MSGDQFSLVWNSFPRNLSSGLYTLLTDEQLVDVTLAAEGQILRAHKLILSVCSTYFRELFKGNSCKHPIVILKDVNYRDLSAMLHFMYQGEVNIKQEDIASFLKVAETLQIKGLTTETQEQKQKAANDVEEEPHPDVCNVHKQIDSVASGVNTHCDEKPSYSSTIDKQSQMQNVSFETISAGCASPDNDTSIAGISSRADCISEPDYVAQGTHGFSDDCRTSMEAQSSEEPLDCTAAIGHCLEKPKEEPLDYTIDVDAEGYRQYPSEKVLYAPEENMQRQDFLPDMQLVPCSQSSQTQPFGINDVVTSLQKDFPPVTGSNYGKGRRTVKGIPSSSLPLETTLRVVSELGPTIRMERGKVIRMYSCPWCLRHFTRKENLKLHVRYIHGPLESLTCKLCGNKYKNSNSLRVHSYLYHNAKRDKHNKPLVSGGV